MSNLAILELFTSLFVQVTIVIGVAAFVSRRGRLGVDADRCWVMTHFGVLLITVAALFGPHLRVTTWAAMHPGMNYPADGGSLAALGQIGVWIWAAGAIGVVLVAIVGMFKATFLVREATPAPGLRERLAPAATQLASGQNSVDVRVSETCGGAFCWQVHQPIVVIPDAVCEFPEAEQAAIMRHELAHLRRQHPLHLFMQRMVEAIYWIHPLVWWSSRQAAAAREIRCDRDAVANRGEVAVYLRSLLRLVELRLTSPSLLPAGLGFLSKPSLLGYRANLLAQSTESQERPAAGWRVVSMLGVAFLLCLVIWLPINPRASRRAVWSPWPSWSAQTLEAVGVTVRDFEIDGHRLDGHESNE